MKKIFSLFVLALFVFSFIFSIQNKAFALGKNTIVKPVYVQKPLSKPVINVPSYSGLPVKPTFIIKKSKNNKNYLQIPSLHSTIQYIISHYPHGNYPVITRSDGEVLYPVNTLKPVVFLEKKRITTIKFPKGMQVLSVALGNTSDFMVTKVSNSVRNYVILKPIRNRLNTDMFVVTNKRSYFFNIIAMPGKFIPMVGFYNPQVYILNYKTQVRKLNSRVIMPSSSFSLNNLNFNYYYKGNGYKPVHVFNNGKFTFIQLRKGILIHPVIFVKYNHRKYLANFLYRDGYYMLRGLPKYIVMIDRTRNTKREEKIYFGIKPDHHWW